MFGIKIFQDGRALAIYKKIRFRLLWSFENLHFESLFLNETLKNGD